MGEREPRHCRHRLLRTERSLEAPTSFLRLSAMSLLWCENWAKLWGRYCERRRDGGSIQDRHASSGMKSSHLVHVKHRDCKTKQNTRRLQGDLNFQMLRFTRMFTQIFTHSHCTRGRHTTTLLSVAPASPACEVRQRSTT